MPALLFIALLVVPLAELWVILQVSQEVGVLTTIALLLLVSVAGTWLLKQQGMATWRRLQEALRSGRMPTDEVSDGALIVVGGALLLTPGFLTDILGLALLAPPTRAALKGRFRRLLARWARRRQGGTGARRRTPREAEVIRVARTEGASAPRLGHPRDAEDDSPDRG